MKNNYFKLFFEKKLLFFTKYLFFQGQTGQNIPKNVNDDHKKCFLCEKNKFKSESLKNTKTKIFIFSNKIFGQKIPKNMTFLVLIRLFSMFFQYS